MNKTRLAAAVWFCSLQNFIVQYVVARTWQTAYSWRLNAISDLGDTSCHDPHHLAVCSPAHTAMNTSFIILGLGMLLGALLLYRRNIPRTSQIGLLCIGMAGLGTILVGLFPENSILLLHVLGAGLAFILGNAAMLKLGFSFKPSWLRWYSLGSGTLGLLATALYLIHYTPYLGPGGMERLAAYPLTIWLSICGLWLLSEHHFDFEQTS